MRPGRSPPQALHAVGQGERTHGRGAGIAWASSACCDQGPPATLGTMRRKRITAGRVLALRAMWLHAGILDGQEMVFPDTGSPQGSVRSPL